MDFAKWISFSIVIILIDILWQIKKLVLLILTAIILALTVNILVEKLEALGMKRSHGVLLSTIGLILFLLSCLLLALPPLFFQFQELFNLVPQGIDKLIVELDKLQDNISPQINNFLPNLEDILPQIQPLFEDLLTRGLDFISGFLGALLGSLLLLALTLMFLGEPLSYQKGFIRFFPLFYRPRITRILQRIHIELEEGLTDTFIKMITVTILTYFCLSIFTVPLVLIQALLAGFLTFIPYIGLVISVISPMAIAFINSPLKPWLILISYIIIHQIIDRIILSKIRKNRIKLIPVNIIIGEVIFANFLGLLGLLLALPLTIICQILIKEILVYDIFDHWQQK